VALLCSGRRGLRFLEHLREILPPDVALSVFSFREEAIEPPFMDDIASLARQVGADFYEAKNVASPRLSGFWESTPVDVLLAVGWRFMVAPGVYQRARRGAYVFHDSLLPRYRGFSPTVAAIINGERETGVTLIEMAEQVDAGAVIDQRVVAIGPDDTVAEVVERVTDAYLDLVTVNMAALLDGTASGTPQDVSAATYACRRVAEDNRIDWSQSTSTVYNLIRGVTHPYPGAFTTLDGRLLRVWASRQDSTARRYVGRVPAGEGVVVLTGDASILLTTVQFDGGAEVCASEVLTSLSHTLGR
jgi:methionyl-tRNA formyltransferase